LKNDVLWVNDNKFTWKDGAGLQAQNSKNVNALSEVAGVNINYFLKMIETDTLPRDYFSTRDRQTTTEGS